MQTPHCSPPTSFLPALLLCTLLGMLCPVAIVGEEKPLPLIEVHTWGDLLAQKPVLPRKSSNLKGARSSFKIGISRITCKRYSSIVLYCVTEHPGNSWGDGDENCLGPFSIEIKTPVESVQSQRAISAMAQLQRMLPAGAEYLFMKTIPLIQKGKYTISIVEPLDDTKDMRFHTVAAAIVKVSGDLEASWSPWEERELQNQTGDAQPAEEGYSTSNVANPASGIALPKYDGSNPIAIDKVPDPAVPLPPLLPAAPDSGVQLILKGNQLTVDLDEKFSTCFPDQNFLTRWWINGRLFVPKLDDTTARLSRAWCGMVPCVAGFRFNVEFHPAPLGLKKGDKVGVQLLFCPGGWEYAGPARQAQEALGVQDALPAATSAENTHISRMSNLVEFVYSGDPAAFVQQPVSISQIK